MGLADFLARAPVRRVASVDEDGNFLGNAYDAVGNKVVVGTAREKFFDNFATFDTVNTWEILTSGPGMTITGPLGGAVPGSTPYLNINSGTTSGSEVVILSRSIFQMPLDVRYQISASQRIANNRAIVALLECNADGTLITSTAYGAGAELLNARNAVGHMHDGTTATTAQLITRAAGSAVDTFANAFGAGFTTVATGTGPNFIASTTYGFMAERDRINSRAWGQNVTTNTGGQFGYDRVVLNPTKLYRLAIIVENSGTPATATDWRFHMVSVMDATRMDVSPRNAGTTDQSKAMSVIANIIGGIITTITTVTTVSAVTAVTNSGTPAAPANPLIINSAASTNGQLVLTGSSGLHAFYATNTGAAPAYVKLYNKATAPTVGTDIPAMILVVPAAVGGVPGVCPLPIGHIGFRFALGLGLAITGGAADNDTAAVAASQVKVILSRTV